MRLANTQYQVCFCMLFDCMHSSCDLLSASLESVAFDKGAYVLTRSYDK